MRVLAAASLIMLILVGLGTFNFYYFDRTANNLSDGMNQLEQKVKQGEWAAADKLIGQFKSSWGNISNKWTILIDHQEIDEINTSVSRIDKYIETKDLPSFMAELAELRLLIEHVPAKEALNIKNIL